MEISKVLSKRSEEIQVLRQLLDNHLQKETKSVEDLKGSSLAFDAFEISLIAVLFIILMDKAFFYFVYQRKEEVARERKEKKSRLSFRRLKRRFSDAFKTEEGNKNKKNSHDDHGSNIEEEDSDFTE